MSALKSLVGLGAIGVFTIGSWFVFSPGAERKNDILKNLPEANPIRMEETRKKNALMMQMLKEVAESDENVLHSFGRKK